MSNSGLNAAKAKKYDEFYTRRQDIEAELRFYRDEFAGKTVYCNCDDPWESEFVQYFCRNFRELGLRKLMATHYEPNKENHSYSISIDGDSDGDGEVTVADLVKTELVCNCDFRSRECIELLDEADIVVTNCKCCWRSLVHQSKVCSASGRSFPGRKLLFSRSESKVFELRCD